MVKGIGLHLGSGVKEPDADDIQHSRRLSLNLKEFGDLSQPVVQSLFEEFCSWRKHRRPNQADVDRFKKYIEILLLELTVGTSNDPTLYLGYNRAKAYFVRGGEYWNQIEDRPILSYGLFLSIIAFFVSAGLIEHLPANAGYGGLSSRIRATKKLRGISEGAGLNWASISVDLSIPSIIVKNDEKQSIAYPEEEFDVQVAQDRLNEINRNLDSSLINLHVDDDTYSSIIQLDSDEDDDLAGARSEVLRKVKPAQPINFADRHLKRVFANSTFSQGGRFYGGWWQRIPSVYRKYIELEDALTVECDYSTMMPRILYAKVDHEPPVDSYTLNGWGSNDEEKKIIRKVAKKAFNQLINSKAVMANPNRWVGYVPDFMPDNLPENWSSIGSHKQKQHLQEAFELFCGRPYSELISQLVELHAPIKDFFFSQSWGWVQRVDSDIAERVMLRLLNDYDYPMTALPIHDSFIVRTGCQEALNDAMHEAFKHVVGVEGMIDIDETILDLPHEASDPNYRIVKGEDVAEDVGEDFERCCFYHQREAEWLAVRGIEGMS